MVGLDVAFAQQLFEGEQDRIAGNAELVGQHAAGGKARARPQTAGQDQLHELAIDLAVQQFVDAAFDVHGDRRGAGSAAAHGDSLGSGPIGSMEVALFTGPL